MQCIIELANYNFLRKPMCTDLKNSRMPTTVNKQQHWKAMATIWVMAWASWYVFCFCCFGVFFNITMHWKVCKEHITDLWNSWTSTHSTKCKMMLLFQTSHVSKAYFHRNSVVLLSYWCPVSLFFYKYSTDTCLLEAGRVLPAQSFQVLGVIGLTSLRMT